MTIATTTRAPVAVLKDKATTPAARDAVALLRADHKLVRGLFSQYEKSDSATKKRQLVALICMELSLNAQVEEEMPYPAVENALIDEESIQEAILFNHVPESF